MNPDPIVVAPHFYMGRFWADMNADRFTRKPEIVTTAINLHGLYGRRLVLVQGAGRGPTSPAVLVDDDVADQIRLLTYTKAVTVERQWLR